MLKSLILSVFDLQRPPTRRELQNILSRITFYTKNNDVIYGSNIHNALIQGKS